jgi:DNA-binding MarR family transcriptional regulator
MSRTQSIEAMSLGLAEAVSRNEWERARRYLDRLKGIMIDSLVQDDPAAIRQVGNVLQQSGERLELLADLPMLFDQTALAWQLRADAGTAALAARVRPAQFESGDEERGASDVRSLLLRVLTQANSPISNSTLASRTGKDPAVISRALKQLEQKGLVRRWLGPNGQKINVLAVGQSEPAEQLNRQRNSDSPSEETDALKQKVVQLAQHRTFREASLNRSDGKSVTQRPYERAVG